MSNDTIHEGLQAALDETPGDKVVLAALADWFEEQGDGPATECLRWLVRNGRRPGFCEQQRRYGKFFWERYGREPVLNDPQAQLPEAVFIKACINCLYSDYSLYGHGLFGCMMCFRNLKADYLKVTTKKDFWSVHGRQDRFVQETYLCPEFERRIPGTGYRG